jgi:hypothetical protein
MGSSSASDPSRGLDRAQEPLISKVPIGAHCTRGIARRLSLSNVFSTSVPSGSRVTSSRSSDCGTGAITALVTLIARLSGANDPALSLPAEDGRPAVLPISVDANQRRQRAELAFSNRANTASTPNSQERSFGTKRPCRRTKAWGLSPWGCATPGPTVVNAIRRRHFRHFGPLRRCSARGCSEPRYL